MAIALVVAAVAALAPLAPPALADVRAGGTITEGVGVSGAALGQTLDQVRASLGTERSCTDVDYFPKLVSTCTWGVEGATGDITVDFGYTTTRPKRRTPPVARVVTVTSDAFSTTRGIAVGDSIDELRAAYGDDLQLCGSVDCVFLGGNVTRFSISKHNFTPLGPIYQISVGSV
jgi:hypothetical protein